MRFPVACLKPRLRTREHVLEFSGSTGGPWARFVQEPNAKGIGVVRYARLIPRDADCARELANRTLTNLYNERPTWLDNAHRRLDEAAFAAYGWSPAPQVAGAAFSAIHQCVTDFRDDATWLLLVQSLRFAARSPDVAVRRAAAFAVSNLLTEKRSSDIAAELWALRSEFQQDRCFSVRGTRASPSWPTRPRWRFPLGSRCRG